MLTPDIRARILIIEDDPDIAAFEQTMLARAGYQTRIAETGREGLDLVKTYKPTSSCSTSACPTCPASTFARPSPKRPTPTS